MNLYPQVLLRKFKGDQKEQLYREATKWADDSKLLTQR